MPIIAITRFLWIREIGEGMRVAAFSLALLLVGFAAHWLLWRVWLPRRQTLTLLAIYVGALLAGLAASWTLDFGPRTIWEALQVATLHIGMSFAYIIAYSTLEEQSPLLGLMKFVEDGGPAGRSRDELLAYVERTQPLGTRIQAMRRDGLIRAENDRYQLTSKGRSWGRLFLAWRRLLHIEVGG